MCEWLVAIREVLGKPPFHQELPPEATHDGVVGMAEYVLARSRSRGHGSWSSRIGVTVREGA